MDVLGKLTEIIDGFSVQIASSQAIKRLIKSSRRQFRASSSQDVGRLTYLATLLYVAGETPSAESILAFIDEHAGEFADGRQDLAVELAFARVIWAHLFRLRGDIQLSQEILARPSIDASSNLDNIAPRDLHILVSRLKHPKCETHKVGENLTSDILLDLELGISIEEASEDNTRSDILRACYHCFVQTVVIRERSSEIRDRISIEDDLKLDEGIENYKNKMVKYLK